jgi:hypothetical protein
MMKSRAMQADRAEVLRRTFAAAAHDAVCKS